MGNLTDDMTRLRGEVDALRGARGALMNDLTRGARDLTTAVAAMRADFASAHTAMAKKTGEERETFVAAVIDEVNSLLGEFSRDRNDMARKGRHDRKTFLSDMSRQVAGMCKETADDLMGARLVWRGERPGKSRPVPMKKKPVVVKPVSPPVEAALKKAIVAAPEFKTEKPPVTFMEPLKKEEEKKTVAAPDFKAEKPPVTFKEPLKKEEEKKTVAAPEFKTEKPPVTFKEPLKKEEEKKTVVAAPQAPAVKPPKVKATPSVSASKPPFQKKKEKSRLDEKPAKAATKAKRGRKFNTRSS
jgi:hypothetical protein